MDGREREAELREALKPFARIAVEFGAREGNAFIIEHGVTLGMCRAARAALNATRSESAPERAAAQQMREALEAFCNPAKLREAVMMSGAHLSHDQAKLIIEEDRLGIRSALASANEVKPEGAR